MGPRLLDDMCQLMRQQSSSFTRSRVELAPNTMVTSGVGTGVYIPRRLLRNRAAMHAHPRKVAPIALLRLSTQ